MSEASFLDRHLGQSPEAFAALPPEQRAPVVRASIPDLNFFFDEGRAYADRTEPLRTRELARLLHEALADLPDAAGSARTLRERIVTDGLLRGEADRDQNVYLGGLFTRRLTRAVPDLIFQPVTTPETQAALRWARNLGVPVTLRGAASTAMGGSVPSDGGLTLDLSRLDGIEVNPSAGVCIIGAGARMRTIHKQLGEQGFALGVYPSNLGGTLAGWFLTGGVGLNAYGRGRALDSVRAADLLLPSGDQVRFHDDGRFDVVEGHSHRTLAGHEVAAWFRDRGCEPMTLDDLAGSEGIYGVLLRLTVRIEPRPALYPFLLSFAREQDALAAAEWVTQLPGEKPANIKFFSGSHMHHVRAVWADEDARTWRQHLGALSGDASLPWRSITGPRELGPATAPDLDHAGAYLFVDFMDQAAARAFGAALPTCPGQPALLGEESVRFAAERFKPMQTKRLGPGLLAAEILMPAAEVPRFLPRAAQLARNVGREVDAEVYYVHDGSTLVIAGYLTDHRSGAFGADLMIAPTLVDLAMHHHQGKPYVLGRWQAAWLDAKVGRGPAALIRAAKRSLDPHAIVNRGVLVDMSLKGPLGAVVASTFSPGVSLLRAIYAQSALSGLVKSVRGLMSVLPGPARGRGGPAVVGADFRAPAPMAGGGGKSLLLSIAPGAPAGSPAQTPEDRALHCVNCGECNTVCPIFHESKIRLPQMLTHIGEAMRGGVAVPATGSTLLDLCMRCGNCEQVCQAGIPHLPMYDQMQAASNRVRPYDRNRHAAVVAAVRGSAGYTRDFLGVRPGGYIKRSPAALPGVPRFLVLRSENDAGPADTCIHCGACVAVCPTSANREFEGADPRWIQTAQERCIGCGSCVEVCPNNHQNGGRTLRVMEAPTPAWFVALDSFETAERR